MTPEELDHTPLTFGKYGPSRPGGALTPDQVSEKDPGWLIWAYETVKDKPVCSKLLYEACHEDLTDASFVDNSFLLPKD